jgi:hypothetical protein
MYYSATEFGAPINNNIENLPRPESKEIRLSSAATAISSRYPGQVSIED